MIPALFKMMNKKINIYVDKIHLDITVFEHEVEKYGKDGLKQLAKDIIERYFHSEYYDPDLEKEILEEKAEAEDILESTDSLEEKEKKLEK